MSDEHRRIAELLRAGDPGRAADLDPQETSRMRGRIVDRVRAGSRRREPGRRRLVPAFLAMLFVLVSAMGIMAIRRYSSVEPMAHQASPGLAESMQNEKKNAEVRRIQHVTAGGTRVVWTLDPDFDL